MIKWAKDLFPICRSLMGDGTRKTFKYFKKLNPEFEKVEFKTGKKVFDWEIPKEWNIKDAYIKHESGKKFADFKKTNLHVVGYSKPINKILSKKDLINKIHTQKDQPNSIPYVTSYYKENWGFCMTEKQKKKLPDGKYKVLIDSSLKKGKLEINHAVIKGKNKKEIFFSSYICHPSMANNELSGPVLINAIMLYLKKKYPKPKYSYRFVLLPETIGSIAYLSKFKKVLKKNVVCGFNLTCVGDERRYTLTKTPSGNTIADHSLNAAVIGLKKVKKHSFLKSKSDERQYCSPGINLPVCAFSKSKEYPEYHTDKDDFKVVTQKGLDDSLGVMKAIIDAFELGIYPKSSFFCEPHLGKRNLYPTISQKGNYSKQLRLRKNLISYSDGQNNIFQIANIMNVPLKTICEQYKLLKTKKILR